MRILTPALLLLAACASSPEAKILALEGDATAGADVFATNCAACHGADGTGGTGADLTAEEQSDQELVETILYGEGSMVGFEGLLEDQEIADVIAFVHTLHGM